RALRGVLAAPGGQVLRGRLAPLPGGGRGRGGVALGRRRGRVLGPLLRGGGRELRRLVLVEDLDREFGRRRRRGGRGLRGGGGGRLRGGVLLVRLHRRALLSGPRSSRPTRASLIAEHRRWPRRGRAVTPGRG